MSELPFNIIKHLSVYDYIHSITIYILVGRFVNDIKGAHESIQPSDDSLFYTN